MLPPSLQGSAFASGRTTEEMGHRVAMKISGAMRRGDVFIGISTSGNSKNLVEALPECHRKGIYTIALTGSKPCKMDDFDLVIKVPSDSPPRIQECQTLIGHIICCIVEQEIFGEQSLK